MKIFPLALFFFLAAAGLVASAATVPAAPGATTVLSPHLSLRFKKMPLGNVARVLSAQFNAPVTIVANAQAPITGDFSNLSLKEALTAAGSQTGLVVVPLGLDASAGFVLCPSVAVAAGAIPTAAGVADSPPNFDSHTMAKIKAELKTAARRRAELLRQRADLLEQSADSDPES
jgi:hypothetical protein